VAHTVDNYQ